MDEQGTSPDGGWVWHNEDGTSASIQVENRDVELLFENSGWCNATELLHLTYGAMEYEVSRRVFELKAGPPNVYYVIEVQTSRYPENRSMLVTAASWFVPRERLVPEKLVGLDCAALDHALTPGASAGNFPRMIESAGTLEAIPVEKVPKKVSDAMREHAQQQAAKWEIALAKAEPVAAAYGYSESEPEGVHETTAHRWYWRLALPLKDGAVMTVEASAMGVDAQESEGDQEKLEFRAWVSGDADGRYVATEWPGVPLVTRAKTDDVQGP